MWSVCAYRCAPQCVWGGPEVQGKSPRMAWFGRIARSTSPKKVVHLSSGDVASIAEGTAGRSLMVAEQASMWSISL